MGIQIASKTAVDSQHRINTRFINQPLLFFVMGYVLLHPEIIRYKQVGQGDLSLHVFKPEKNWKGEKQPAIVYFYGGGWSLGTPLQFYRECAWYASKGMVAVSAEYRISYLHHTTPFESLEDAHDAIAWLRKHAEELNIDTSRIVAAGASAGGHLAAATGIIRSPISY